MLLEISSAGEKPQCEYTHVRIGSESRRLHRYLDIKILSSAFVRRFQIANPLVHKELHTFDTSRSKEFYNGLFFWQLENLPIGDSSLDDYSIRRRPASFFWGAHPLRVKSDRYEADNDCFLLGLCDEPRV